MKGYVSIPASGIRAGLLYFYVQRRAEEGHEIHFVSIPASGIVVFLHTDETRLVTIAVNGFHPGERDCCISTWRRLVIIVTRIEGFHPGERDCCISTRRERPGSVFLELSRNQLGTDFLTPRPNRNRL